MKSLRRAGAWILGAAAIACAKSGVEQLNETSTNTVQPVVVSYSRVAIDVATNPTNVVATTAADVDRDGRVDLVFADENDGVRAWYRNAPGGAWSRHEMPGGVSESGFACGDLNRDGLVDCADGTQWYAGNADGTFTASTFPQPIGDHNVVMADVDGNGLLDVVGRPDSPDAHETSDQVGILYQGPPGVWTLKSFNPGVCLNGLDVADVDGDGRLDIVLCKVWLQQPCDPAGVWTQRQFAADWNDFATVTAVDMDRDGDLDVLLTVSEDVGKISWFENPGNPRAGNLWLEHVIDPAFPKAHSALARDLNADGLIDVAASSYDGPAGPLNVYTNLGGAISWSVQTLGNDSLHSFVAADLNGDGLPDLAGARFVNNITDGLFAYMTTNALSSSCSGMGGMVGSGGSGNAGASNGGTVGTGGAQSGGQAQGGALAGGMAAGGSSGNASSGGQVASGGALSSGGVAAGGASGGSGAGGGSSELFGETAVGTSDNNAGIVIAQKATLATAGTVQSLSFYVSAPTGKLLVGVYDALGTGGNPKNLKIGKEITTLVTGWNTVSVTPTALSAGTYWLVHEPSNGSMTYSFVSGGNALWANRLYPSGTATLPATFPTTGLSSGSFHWSFYGIASVP